MRRRAVVAGVIAIAIAGCGKGSSTKPYLEGKLAPQHAALQDVEFDLTLPEGMKPNPASGAEVRWIGTHASDTLDVTIQVATPTVMQNALNFEAQTDRRVSRSDATADGWLITSGDQSGSTLISKRMIQKDRRAIFCTAMMTWATPGHDPKRTAWVEAVCNSLTPTKFD